MTEGAIELELPPPPERPHIATIGFSVRNWLAFRQVPLDAEQLLTGLHLYWSAPGVERIEVADVVRALEHLRAHGMVRAVGDGTYLPTNPKIMQVRPAYRELAEDDPRAWEGWL